MNFRYVVSLRMWHPSINPDQITKKLNLIPTYKWIAGSRSQTPTGKLLDHYRKDTFWNYNIPKDDDIELDEFLGNFMKRLMPYKRFLRKLHATGGRLEFFIGYFMNSSNSGNIFPCELLTQLAELNIDLDIDIYERDKKG